MKGKLAMVFGCAAFALGGCASPKGGNVSDKRDYAERMRRDTLMALYQQRPEARSRIENAAGYAVFSNIGFTAVFLGAGNGYGVVVEKENGRHTYMRMFQGSAGLGLGVKDYRAVFVFFDREALRSFVEEGWDFGGSGDASAKLGDTGAALTSSGTFDAGMDIYEFTENGVMAHATVSGAKFWPDSNLN